MNDSEAVLQLTERLLESISAGDWETYVELADPSLTAFEPEGQGTLIQGLEFHRFFFEPGSRPARMHTTITSPHVRVMGDVAVVAYVRLNQRADETKAVTITAAEETRIWQRREGRWRNVHFHRSRPSK